MEEIPPNGSQLDRIESSITQVLDRLTRMEERQNSHAGQIESQQVQLSDLANRVREAEISHAVSAATGSQTGQQLQGRWAAIGGAAFVLLGSIGAFVGNFLVKMIHSVG